MIHRLPPVNPLGLYVLEHGHGLFENPPASDGLGPDSFVPVQPNLPAPVAPLAIEAGFAVSMARRGGGSYRSDPSLHLSPQGRSSPSGGTAVSRVKPYTGGSYVAHLQEEFKTLALRIKAAGDTGRWSSSEIEEYVEDIQEIFRQADEKRDFWEIFLDEWMWGYLALAVKPALAPALEKELVPCFKELDGTERLFALRTVLQRPLLKERSPDLQAYSRRLKPFLDTVVGDGDIGGFFLDLAGDLLLYKTDDFKARSAFLLPWLKSYGIDLFDVWAEATTQAWFTLDADTILKMEKFFAEQDWHNNPNYKDLFGAPRMGAWITIVFHGLGHEGTWDAIPGILAGGLGFDPEGFVSGRRVFDGKLSDLVVLVETRDEFQRYESNLRDMMKGLIADGMDVERLPRCAKLLKDLKGAANEGRFSDTDFETYLGMVKGGFQQWLKRIGPLLFDPQGMSEAWKAIRQSEGITSVAELPGFANPFREAFSSELPRAVRETIQRPFFRGRNRWNDLRQNFFMVFGVGKTKLEDTLNDILHQETEAALLKDGFDPALAHLRYRLKQMLGGEDAADKRLALALQKVFRSLAFAGQATDARNEFLKRYEGSAALRAIFKCRPHLAPWLTPTKTLKERSRYLDLGYLEGTYLFARGIGLEKEFLDSLRTELRAELAELHYTAERVNLHLGNLSATTHPEVQAVVRDVEKALGDVPF